MFIDSLFVPKEHIQLNFGKNSINVYPKSKNTMSSLENAYAFMVNKSLVESSELTAKTKLQGFGEWTNTSSLVGIL